MRSSRRRMASRMSVVMDGVISTTVASATLAASRSAAVDFGFCCITYGCRTGRKPRIMAKRIMSEGAFTSRARRNMSDE